MELIETDMSNIYDPGFKATIIRMLAGLEKSIQDIKEMLSAGIKDLKASQAEIKNAITKMWKQLDVMTTRMEEAEKIISDKEDKIMENNEAEKKER